MSQVRERKIHFLEETVCVLTRATEGLTYYTSWFSIDSLPLGNLCAITYILYKMGMLYSLSTPEYSGEMDRIIF